MGVTIENKRLRVELNDPGVHPFVTLMVPGAEEPWEPAVILGARQLEYLHKGASFPRMISDGREAESGAQLKVETVPAGERAVTITDIRGGFEVASRLRLDDELPLLHVEHRLKPLAEVALNRAFDRFDFLPAPGSGQGNELDYSFVPHLRPEEDMVIGDFVFRSPVVMMSKDGVFFAVMPDLETVEEAYRSGHGGFYLDFVVTGGENLCPAVCYGLGNTRVKGHVYFKADFGNEMAVSPPAELVFGYHLALDRDGFGRDDTMRFLWERYGKGRVAGGLPQVAGLDRYAAAGLGRMFKRSDLFRRFEIDGQPCGGTVAQHLVTRRGVRLMDLGGLNRYLRYQKAELLAFRAGVELLSGRPGLGRLFGKAVQRYGPKVPPQILFQSWFNNLRSAYGAYWFARKWNDRELLEASLDVKNLAILAPRESGAFPAVCYATDEGIFWSNGTRGFEHIDWYHTADCATTGYYMALWFRDHEGDPRLLWRCGELADFLIKVQLSSGAYPTWVRPGSPLPEVSDDLKESATTACPAMFMALLYLLEGNERYLDSARWAAEFIASNVMPRQKWFDYETFYSCSRKRQDMFDAYTQTYPQNAMSMIWAAEAFRLLHLATAQQRYLDLGREVLDHLCLFQQIWDPPFLSINAFGGFASMNTDAEWNDARQALVAPLLADYYRLTGLEEYMERSTAALRASFTTMFIDENRSVAPGIMVGATHEETGSVAENYGHFGYDGPTMGYLESDWGPGSAGQAAAYIQKHYGDIFVDAPRNRAFGINGCRVKGMSRSGETIELDVERQVDTGLDVVIKVEGAGPGTEVRVNGAGARKTPDGDFHTLL